MKYQHHNLAQWIYSSLELPLQIFRCGFVRSLLSINCTLNRTLPSPPPSSSSSSISAPSSWCQLFGWPLAWMRNYLFLHLASHASKGKAPDRLGTGPSPARAQKPLATVQKERVECSQQQRPRHPKDDTNRPSRRDNDHKALYTFIKNKIGLKRLTAMGSERNMGSVTAGHLYACAKLQLPYRAGLWCGKLNPKPIAIATARARRTWKKNIVIT